MKSFYFSGQRTFGNRGCEAIIRSTVDLLRDAYGDVRVLVPSDNIPRDSSKWKDAANYGVTFVDTYKSPYARYWVHAQRLPLRHLKQMEWPFAYPEWLKDQIRSVDCVLAVGGDNYSLDYRIPSPIMGLDKLAMDLGKPVVLWGASVGPFEREPYFVPTMKKHLARMKNVAVRESASYEYLTKVMGLRNVSLMADPAFNLRPEVVEFDDLWPQGGDKGVLGFNVSPLIERYKRDGLSLIDEAADFIRQVVQKKGLSVLLVPHVSELDGSSANSDHAYMLKLLHKVSDLGAAVKILPDTYNASQLKFFISKLDYFIGARTHATIAAMSSCVPTVSIAYSVKAIGINKDLFGSQDMVLPTPELSSSSLNRYFDWLVNNESSLRLELKRRVPEVRELSRNAIRNF